MRCTGSADEPIGGANRDRTDDLYNAIVVLSQLSYSPTCWRTHRIMCALSVRQAGALRGTLSGGRRDGVHGPQVQPRMALLAQIFQPFAEEHVHAHAMVDDRGDR